MVRLIFGGGGGGTVLSLFPRPEKVTSERYE